jgi:hypothetical protein
MHFPKLLSLGLVLIFPGHSIFSQQLKLGQDPYSVHKAAVLELKSDNQGLLMVRISDTSLINLLSPPDGMLIYFVPSRQLLLRANGYWQPLINPASLNNYWSITGNTNGVIKQFGNIDNYDLPVITNNIERMRITNAGNIGIGSSSFDVSNPEKLLVDAGNTSSFNVISGKGSINNYLQLNIQNRLNGNTASSDLVASADNGSESVNYVDLGINSSGFTNTTYPILGGINTAYLYSTGNDFVIGNAIAGKNLLFFTGGYTAANERIRIDGNGRVGIGVTSPTAILHLKAGSATANTAPLKFTSGTNLTTPENGSVEFNGTHFYATIGSTRYQIDQQTGTTYTGSNGITLLGNDFRNNLITGIAGDQTVTGGTGATNSLTLSSTNHLSKGKIIFGTSAYDEANNRFGIGNSVPSEALDITGNLKFSGALMPNNTAGTSGYLLKSNGAGVAPTWINFGLSNLSDATITTPANGQFLQYNGTKWINSTPSYLTSIDTSNIASFYQKVRAELSAGTGISYNNGTGVISNSGVTSVNGNTGALTMDTGYISNFYLKTRSLFSAGSGITYNTGTGVISSSLNASDYWSLSGNTVGAIKKIGTIDNYDLPVITNNIERIRIANTGNIGIGSSTFDVSNPEKLLVEAGNTSSFNVISGKGTINNYLQLNIQNKSTGIAASSDLVASADNGNESVNFVDLGINSSGYTGTGILAGVNTGYLYNTGNDFAIGNATAAKNLIFFTGGTGTVNERMRIDGTGKIGIGTTSPNNYLEVAGTNTGTGVSGLRLTNLGTATTATANSKVLSVNSTGDLIVTNNPAASQWLYTGNSGINAAVNFLGTTDDKQMILKSNNQSFLEFGRRQTLGLTQAYTDYDDNDEKVTYVRSALQFEAANASFYKPKIFTDANGNFRIKGSSAGTDYFELGSTGTANSGGFEFIIGDDGDEPILFKSYHYINGMSEIMRLQSGRMAVGSNAFDATNPEKLLIDAGTTTSYNLMTGKGSIDNYLQINVQNRSAGGSASSDLVATSNNGSESANFIDMGINSGSYTNVSYPVLGGANTAYLYSTGNDLVMGNATAAKNFRFFTGGTATTNERMRIDGTGHVGIGTTAPAYPLSVEESGGTVASFNRTASDGTIISLMQAGNQEGSISVSGSTVSYNAFTGSHYAWTAQAIEKGTLVTLIGENQYFHGNKNSEIIYGIRPSTLPNDPKTMGAYLGLQESGLPYSVDNPHLVMGVGNGVMWVVDKGEDIVIGDYLISSDVAGHAMKENGTYPTAFIVARVAEPVKWSSETAMINGIKHKLISVFFENFVRNNAQKELEILKKEVKELKERMSNFENKIGVLFTF